MVFTRFRPLLVAWGACLVATTGSFSTAQDVPAVPVVARDEMKLEVKDEIIDIIQRGDLLTVVESRPKHFLVLTPNGKKALVGKANVTSLAESVEIYDDLIAETPDAGRLYTLRASAWWAKQENEKALADFNRAIELGYDEPHAYSSRGLFHASLGNLDEALADHTTAIEKGDKTEAPYINRAAARLLQQRPDLAVEDYAKAIEISPKNSNLHYQRALAWKAQGKFDETTADFEKAIELDANNFSAVMARGFFRFQQKLHQAAVDDFTTAVKINPKSALAYNNRGYNLMRLEKWPEALADFDKAIELAPKYGLAYQNKAWLLATAGDESARKPSEAIRAANKACELSKFQNITDVSSLAAALAADGQWEKAIGWQEKVISLGDEKQKEFARKILKLYEEKKPFDASVGETNETPAPETKPETPETKPEEKSEEKKPDESK